MAFGGPADELRESRFRTQAHTGQEKQPRPHLAHHELLVSSDPDQPMVRPLDSGSGSRGDSDGFH